MAQLISMRQRIKAVETIKKITHAMRLISMSSHSRLRQKKVHLEEYKKAFENLWTKIAPLTQGVHQDSLADSYQLIILVSSQKGLCGTFNSSLFKFFHQEIPLQESMHFIAVGKYAHEYLAAQKKTPLASYNNFTVSNFVAISRAITDLILQKHPQYHKVVVVSNYQKSFFLQKPRATQLYPLPKNSKYKEPTQDHGYLFEQTPEELSATILQLMLTVSLEELLFDSLLAEQAARFLSMDSSTRNADKLLVSMKLEYNKRRQSAITAELTELATSIT